MSEVSLIYTFGMMFGTHSCISDKLSREVSDLKLSKDFWSLLSKKTCKGLIRKKGTSTENLGEGGGSCPLCPPCSRGHGVRCICLFGDPGLNKLISD